MRRVLVGSAPSFLGVSGLIGSHAVPCSRPPSLPDARPSPGAGGELLVVRTSAVQDRSMSQASIAQVGCVACPVDYYSELSTPRGLPGALERSVARTDCRERESPPAPHGVGTGRSLDVLSCPTAGGSRALVVTPPYGYGISMSSVPAKKATREICCSWSFFSASNNNRDGSLGRRSRGGES